MNEMIEGRKKLVAWIKQHLSGDLSDEEKQRESVEDEESIIPHNPFDLYTTGILYPIYHTVEADNEDDAGVDEDKAQARSATSKRRYQPPSTLGFSFYAGVDLDILRIDCSAFVCAKYPAKDEDDIDNTEGAEKPKTGFKKEVKTFSDGIPLTAGEEIKLLTLWGGLAQLSVISRPYQDGNILTISLTNNAKKTNDDAQLAENSLFAVNLQCCIDKNAVRDYPRTSTELLTPEERELELRYKDEQLLAVGHGTAAAWREASNGLDLEIYSDFMPTVEVPQVTANTGNAEPVLSFALLADIENNDQVFSQLDEFIDSYGAWIEEQTKLPTDTPSEQQTAAVLIERMRTAKERMQQGVALIKCDANACHAFALANRAILMQMQQGRAEPATPFSWRPFQLAFFIMTLESVVNDSSEFRDCVDLIWFPTGGGKTEAYLGVMAFAFVYRRLRYSNTGGGTTAIMRYTLRLLTSQQFSRACKVIGALEIIRRQADNLGDTPFSIGLWVGGATTPNTFKQAIEFCKKQNIHKFILQSCPWCGQQFNLSNFHASEHSFHIVCNNSTYELGEGKLPLPFNVVDEALYKNPPTLLIATVDKFARLAWEERASSFFGKRTRPPELIIQDELHLIAGPLGSIVGMYECGFETVLRALDVYPKFIASTATIRQAEQQVKALFGREQMAVFPPVGLRQSDSYFAKEVPTSVKPGRLYVGYMAFGRPRATSAVELLGAVRAATKVLFTEDEPLRDAWWTQLIYHGSLKSLGNTHTNLQRRVGQYKNQLLLSIFVNKHKCPPIPGSNEAEFFSGQAKAYTGEDEPPSPEAKTDYKQYFDARAQTIKSLNSTQTAEQNNQVFANLKKEFGDPDCIDTVLATNMVSVGLDEPRLAIMVINGQPLTTAEYIQASSRVGRGEVPGIVLVNYYKTQASSLSHYESFQAYHRSFYRFVEPSSVTPFTPQVRKRTLHAALVIAIRHGCPHLLSNGSAQDFDPQDPRVVKILKLFKQRLHAGLNDSFDDNERLYAQCLNHLEELVNAWYDRAQEATNFHYNSRDNSAFSLLLSMDASSSKPGLWPTLNSMRNVESMALFELKT